VDHEIIKIRQVKVLDPYQLEITFETGERKVVDLSPVLHGSLFGELRDWETFCEVRVNPEVKTIEWPNGADFDPETLYRWEHYKNELSERLKKAKEMK